MTFSLPRVISYLVFCFGLFAAITALAEDRLSPKAEQHFDAGIAYVDDPAGPKYEGAYEEFKSELKDANRDDTQPERTRSLRDEGKLYALLTDIGIGAAVLSAGVTAYLYFSQPSNKTEQRAPTAMYRLEPMLGSQSAGLSVAGKV